MYLLPLALPANHILQNAIVKDLAARPDQNGWVAASVLNQTM